jgi:hypothetical protein
MKLTTKKLKQLIVEELEEVHFAPKGAPNLPMDNTQQGPAEIGHEQLISAVQDILYREPPQGEEAMDLDKGGVVRDPNKLAGAIGMKIFKMLYPEQ